MNQKAKMPPHYDPDIPPVMNITQIQQLLPHRYPMGLVDKVIEISDNEIVGLKNVTINEEYFTGHFPSEPIMPAVYLIEAMAQCGGLLALCQVDEPQKYSTYFLSIKEARFKRKVQPGDTLIIRVSYQEPPSHLIATMHAECYVGSRIVAESTFTASLVKNDH